ncbi:PAS domain-containing protein [Sporosarcina sp. BI001-red]|uniref:PAS domain-containing sensor histidine kinase n=1 Tax=Sporosarcina sp. BI001-red TaxID=2282866 RepID=UPI000E233912|nr:PAS domain-containing sensor histidine kinase [Sporosarcina sp. BI001-red]REB07865.1 PAS domain-containing protein [Sporosarcina sp. BI001-red]
MAKGLQRLAENPLLYTKDNMIYRVSESFLHLTGYEECDLIGKSLLELDRLLKSEHQISFQDLKGIYYPYIFNSDNEPLEVKVSFDILDKEDHKVYYFEEQKNLALQFLLKNFGGSKTNKNGTTAVFSYPNCILLSHDQNYITTLCLMDIASDNPLGKYPSFSNSILDVLKQGTSFHEFEVESRGSDGAATYWDINVKMIWGDGTTQYVVISFYDVTEKTRERKLLMKKRSEMEFIVDSMSDVVKSLDKDGEYTYKNIEPGYKNEEYTALQESVEEISMYYASFSHKDYKINYLNQFAFQAFKEEWPEIKIESDIIGKDFFNYYRTEDVEELIQDINKSIETQTSYLHKLEFTKDGKTYHTKTIFQPIINQNNEVEKIIALGIDISDEELANKAMAKLLKAQEELFINTSHELKTPLTVIFSGAQLLNLYLEHDSLEDYREDILNVNRMTIRNCYRLTRLINNILDISKIETGLYELNLSNYNIVGIVDDIVESVSEYTKSKGIKIVFDPDLEELMMAVDVSKFDRILLNLISNAIKFSIAGEAILIRLVEKDKHTVSISVTDEGIGIDPKNVDVIFEKFTQLNRSLNRIAEGTGLGLSIAKSLAELHGGSISVKSTLNEGSTFTIELPTKRIDSSDNNQIYTNNMDRVELIKYEFSDIYL